MNDAELLASMAQEIKTLRTNMAFLSDSIVSAEAEIEREREESNDRLNKIELLEGQKRGLETEIERLEAEFLREKRIRERTTDYTVGSLRDEIEQRRTSEAAVWRLRDQVICQLDLVRSENQGLREAVMGMARQLEKAREAHKEDLEKCKVMLGSNHYWATDIVNFLDAALAATAQPIAKPEGR